MSRIREWLERGLHSPWGWIGLGAFLRLVHILTLGNRAYFGDTIEYEAAGLRILHGMGIDQVSPRAPLYPLLMAVSFRIGGEGHYFLTRVLTLIIAVALMAVAALLAQRLGGRPAAILTAVGMALSPTILFVSGLLYPTSLYMFLLLSMTLVAWDLSERPTLVRGGLLGALFALGWLTDQVILAPAGAIGLWLLVRRSRPIAPFARALAVGGVVAAVLILPYVVVLKRAGGDGVFMRKAQTILFSARTDPDLARDRWLRLPPDAPFVAQSPPGFVRSETRLFLHAPVAYTHDWIWEFFHFFRPVADRVQSRNRYTQEFILLMGGMHFVALMTLALLGLGIGTGPRAGRLLLAANVLATACFYAFFFTQTRYRIPIEPHLTVLAALGVQRAFPRATAWLDGADSSLPPARTGT